MRVECAKCGRIYDDATCWTICPHNILYAAPDAPRYNCGMPGYCAGHDLFNCTLTPPYSEGQKVLLRDCDSGCEQVAVITKVHVPAEPFVGFINAEWEEPGARLFTQKFCDFNLDGSPRRATTRWRIVGKVD